MKQLFTCSHYLIVMALLLIPTTLAEASSFYIFSKGGHLVHKDHQYRAADYLRNDTTLASFQKQVHSTFEYINTDLVNELLNESKENGLNFNVTEYGIGYYKKLFIPIAVELGGLSNYANNEHQLFFLSHVKCIIPLSMKYKAYIKLGKIFKINSRNTDFEFRSLDYEKCLELWGDIKNQLWYRSPAAQWENSMTALGLGGIARLSSKLEIDLSLNAWVSQNSQHHDFSLSLGLHYLL